MEDLHDDTEARFCAGGRWPAKRTAAPVGPASPRTSVRNVNSCTFNFQLFDSFTVTRLGSRFEQQMIEHARSPRIVEGRQVPVTTNVP